MARWLLHHTLVNFRGLLVHCLVFSPGQRGVQLIDVRGPGLPRWVLRGNGQLTKTTAGIAKTFPRPSKILVICPCRHQQRLRWPRSSGKGLVMSSLVRWATCSPVSEKSG